MIACCGNIIVIIINAKHSLLPRNLILTKAYAVSVQAIKFPTTQSMANIIDTVNQIGSEDSDVLENNKTSLYFQEI